MFGKLSALLLASAALLRAAQLPLTPSNLVQEEEPFNGFAAPEQMLSAVSADEYTTMSHPAIQGYSARVKMVKDWCDPTVKAYTGYLDIDMGAKHLFFYFFESRSDPVNDPLVMWTNGGPGGSSAIGLFMELGPCRIDEGNSKNGTTFNPYGWNDKANLFFIDQPIGVGYSYADYGEFVDTTEEAAKNIAAFMYLFTETFPNFKGRPFHMSGESYGGRYIPVFASEIVDQNKKAEAKGLTPINLASVMIGNGYTDVSVMMLSYYDIVCTNASILPVLDIATCVRMKTSVPLCQSLMAEHCTTSFDSMGCTAAALFCKNEFEVPFRASGLNQYDISVPCVGGNLCYPVIEKITEYLNAPEIRSTLGADPNAGNWSSINRQVNEDFQRQMDMWHLNQYYITGLLERGIDVLIYVGSYDWICNWVGNSRWVTAMEWGGQKEYNSKNFEEWMVDGRAAGITKSAKGLTFATVYAAGHMVPYNKPAESLALVNRWMESRYIME